MSAPIPVVGTFAFEQHGGDLFKVMTIEPLMNLSEDLKKRLDTIARATGLVQSEDLHYIVAQVKAQGFCMTVDIRQLAARGIPIYQALAIQTGIPVSKVSEASEQGSIRFFDLEMAIIGMTDPGGIFHRL